ncbi:lycopene cyclase domain-containing protein [Microbacterium lacusdiani]
MSPLYLAILLLLLGCMVLVDRRWRLAFWRDSRRATVVLIVGVALLLVADVVGIALGVFHLSTTWVMTGVVLGPEMPIEEPVFLVFLVYLTINLLGLFGPIQRRPPR